MGHNIGRYDPAEVFWPEGAVSTRETACAAPSTIEMALA
jgi:hypothetical protein